MLNEKRVGRVQTAVAETKKPTSYSVVVCGPWLATGINDGGEA